jgi:hypothetical protein
MRLKIARLQSSRLLGLTRVSRREESTSGHIHLDTDPDLDQVYHIDVDPDSDISLYQTDRNNEYEAGGFLGAVKEICNVCSCDWAFLFSFFYLFLLVAIYHGRILCYKRDTTNSRIPVTGRHP